MCYLRWGDGLEGPRVPSGKVRRVGFWEDRVADNLTRSGQVRSGWNVFKLDWVGTGLGLSWDWFSAFLYSFFVYLGVNQFLRGMPFIYISGQCLLQWGVSNEEEQKCQRCWPSVLVTGSISSTLQSLLASLSSLLIPTIKDLCWSKLWLCNLVNQDLNCLIEHFRTHFKTECEVHVR